MRAHFAERVGRPHMTFGLIAGRAARIDARPRRSAVGWHLYVQAGTDGRADPVDCDGAPSTVAAARLGDG